MNININGILSILDDKEDYCIKKLLTHERNKKVTFSSGAYYMRDKENNLKILKGLLPSLQSCFWPKFNYFSILSKLKKNPNKKNIVNKEPSGKYYGKIRG